MRPLEIDQIPSDYTNRSASLRIELANFKSFESISADFSPFTVLIGANASGKSNLVEAVRFVRDVTNMGLVDAVSLQGGPTYLRNAVLGSSRPLTLRVRFNPDRLTAGSDAGNKSELTILPRHQEYELEIRFNKRGEGFRVLNEVYRHHFTVFRPTSKGSDLPSAGTGRLEIRNREGRVGWDLEFAHPELRVDSAEIAYIPPVLSRRRIPNTDSLLEYVFVRFAPFGGQRPFEGIAIYDFDPKLPKHAMQVTGRAVLDETGSNLAIVLRNLLQRPEQRERLTATIEDMLPFASKFGVDTVAGKSLMFRMHDAYLRGLAMPASLLSDGTINIVALVIALLFQDSALVVVEEPERNLHPKLISKAVELMKQAAARKFVLATSHSPEVVRQAGLENLLLVRRDRSGFSQLLRPRDSVKVRAFMKEDLGLDDLHIQELLGI